ncbi:MAG TPA: heparan-alpha-glucosaminide N-acetyltransferase domain-containing protein, partial [Nevskia sp.]|nr:heparan-alpha-glucosaminide N-acetyltransferase domain-containing protein [Nevskia sp.]
MAELPVSTAAAAQTAYTTAAAPPRVANRIGSIDLMRGIVMIVMAIDHVRDFFNPFSPDPTDLSQASAALFLTRWITHFCAPSFMFLAGTSAWLYARNTGATRGQLQRFLLSRGLWLVFLELTWISFAWRFDFNGLNLQVIWALGWSMVCLAGLLWLPRPAMLAFGLVLVFGHNAFDGWHFKDFAAGGEWQAWLFAMAHELHFGVIGNGYQVLVLYPLIPWVGVMALGYCFGAVLELPAPQRDRWMRMLGGAAIALFLLLRLTNVYGDTQLWQINPRGPLYTALDVLDVSKYPPSLQYLLMTLGPVLLLLPWLER